MSDLLKDRLKDTASFKNSLGLRIVLWPNQILETESKDFDFSQNDLDRFFETISSMFFLMNQAGGIGLAAPQVNLDRKFFIMKTDKLRVVANPEIISKQKKIQSEEGCLSFLNFKGKVSRNEEIVVKYNDFFGKPIEETLNGIDSICFQHEYDHIFGKTIFDSLGSKSDLDVIQKSIAKRKRKILKSHPDLYV